MKGMVAGTHRRHRASPRTGRGAVWTGLFLILAIIALVASRGLWTGVFENLIRPGPASIPQAEVVWRNTGEPGSTGTVSSTGQVLLTHAAGLPAGDSAGVQSCVVALADAGGLTVAGEVDGTVLAGAFYDSRLTVPPAGKVYADSDWRILFARSETAGDGDITGLEDVVSRLEDGDAAEVAFRAEGAVSTSACPWADEASFILALFEPGRTGGSPARIVAVGDGGQELWSRDAGADPVHRLVSRPGTGFVAAASARTLTLLDSHGTMLWTKNLRSDIESLSLQSHGGPAIVAGGELLVYDRRGNLSWSKKATSPMTLVDCEGDRIAVAASGNVCVYDEDGMERWGLALASRPLSIDLDHDATYLAVCLETGEIVVARAPGATSMRQATGERLAGPAEGGSRDA